METTSIPFSAPTFKLLGSYNKDRRHGFLGPVLHQKRKTGLSITAKHQNGSDDKVKIVLKTLNSGDIQVTFNYGLDNNSNAGDGRIYFQDRFIFDRRSRDFKGHSRHWALARTAGKIDLKPWQKWLAQYRSLKKPDQGRARAFAEAVVQDYLPQEIALPAQGRLFFRMEAISSTPEFTKNLGQGGQQYLLAARESARRVVRPHLEFKLKNPHSHYTTSFNGRENEITISIMVQVFAKKGDTKPMGWLMMRDTFITDGSRLKKFGGRKWILGPKLRRNAGFAKDYAKLRRLPPPKFSEAQALAHPGWIQAVRWGNARPLSQVNAPEGQVARPSGGAPQTKGFSIRQITMDRFPKGLEDINADGKITEEDDWIIWAAHQDALGHKLPEVKKHALKFWEQQASQGHPDARRNLQYWKGTRKLKLPGGHCHSALATWIKNPVQKRGDEDWLPFPDLMALEVKPSQNTHLFRMTLMENGNKIDGARIDQFNKGNQRVFTWPKTAADTQPYELHTSCLVRKGTHDELVAIQSKDKVWTPIVATDLDVDLPNQRITFRHNQAIPIETVDVSFYSSFQGENRRSEQGRLFHKTFRLTAANGQGKGSVLQWKKGELPEDKVKEASIVFHDPHRVGNSSHTMTHWRTVVPIQIPHAEVKFRTNEADPLPGEINRKVNPVISKAHNLISAYPKQDFQLWIVGHADRVGTEEDNLRLSRARAETISQYFHQWLGQRNNITKGIPLVTVNYIGLGESVARKKGRRDEVGNQKDRRVDYILSEKPPFKGNWQKIPPKK